MRSIEIADRPAGLIASPTSATGRAVTTPARTLLDVATVLGAATVARFAETWLSTGVATVDELELIVASHRRHRVRAR